MSNIRLWLAKFGYFSKPDFLIVGAQKAGTSSLYEALSKHPMISGALWKELHYFDRDGLYHPQKHYRYHQFFPLPAELAPGKHLLFEATPIYMYHPEVPERIYRYNPEIKLIFILRNPAHRALSAWSMYHFEFKRGSFSHLHDKRSFTEAIAEEMDQPDQVNFYNDERAYVKRGVYYEQIKLFLNLFPMENLLILDYEMLADDQEKLLKRTTSFLGVPSFTTAPAHVNKRIAGHPAAYQEELSLLQTVYQPYNEQLFSLINMRFSW